MFDSNFNDVYHEPYHHTHYPLRAMLFHAADTAAFDSKSPIDNEWHDGRLTRIS